MNAQQLLEKAADLIDTRAAERDTPRGDRTMAMVVAIYNLLEETELTESQGWRFMAILKAVRSSRGDHDVDDYIDGAAYFALAGEAAAKENFEPAEQPLTFPSQPGFHSIDQDIER